MELFIHEDDAPYFEKFSEESEALIMLGARRMGKTNLHAMMSFIDLSRRFKMNMRNLIRIKSKQRRNEIRRNLNKKI
jgi:flagellar basal body rod protein FlgF